MLNSEEFKQNVTLFFFYFYFLLFFFFDSSCLLSDFVWVFIVSLNSYGHIETEPSLKSHLKDLKAQKRTQDPWFYH